MQEEKLKLAKELLDLANRDFITQKDLKEFVSAFLSKVAEIKAVCERKYSQTDSEIKDYDRRFYSYCEKIENNLKKSLINLENKTMQDTDKIMEKCMKAIKEVADLIPEIPEIPDLTDIENKVSNIEQKLSQPIKTETPNQVIQKINKGTNFIDKERIEGWSDEINRLERKIDTKPTRITGMRKIPVTSVYNLTSQVNGSLKSFNLPKDTVKVHAVWGTQFPVIFDPAADWTFTGNSLILGNSVTAPATGQTLLALIETLFYS